MIMLVGAIIGSHRMALEPARSCGEEDIDYSACLPQACTMWPTWTREITSRPRVWGDVLRRRIERNWGASGRSVRPCTRLRAASPLALVETWGVDELST